MNNRILCEINSRKFYRKKKLSFEISKKDWTFVILIVVDVKEK